MILLCCENLSAQISASEVAKRLDSLKQIISAQVTTQLQQTNFTSSYTTVWRAYEDGAIVALENILPRLVPELTATNFDTGKTGSEKNRLAVSLALLCWARMLSRFPSSLHVVRISRKMNWALFTSIRRGKKCLLLHSRSGYDTTMMTGKSLVTGHFLTRRGGSSASHRLWMV